MFLSLKVLQLLYFSSFLCVRVVFSLFSTTPLHFTFSPLNPSPPTSVFQFCSQNILPYSFSVLRTPGCLLFIPPYLYNHLFPYGLFAFCSETLDFSFPLISLFPFLSSSCIHRYIYSTAKGTPQLTEPYIETEASFNLA